MGRARAGPELRDLIAMLRHVVASAATALVCLQLIGCADGPSGASQADTTSPDGATSDVQDTSQTPSDTQQPPNDTGPSPDDAASDIGPELDTTSPSDTSPDGGPSDGTVEAPPAVVVDRGTEGFLLRGVVLTPTGALDPGEVLFIGNTIVCVATSCSGHALAGAATVIDTKGVISPGLIDAHNHLTYNFLSEWVPGRFFDSRDVWVDDPSYEDHIAPFADGRNQNERICPAAKWGELRSLIHGTTTVQGQSFNRSCLNRLVRNADHFHGLGSDHMATNIASPADINTEDAIRLAERFSDTDTPTTRYAVHMCEGLRGSNMAIEFESFAGRDPRTQLARHQGLSLLSHDGAYTDPRNGTVYDFFYRGVAILIHSLLLNETQLQEVKDTDSFIVWSPSSNLALYDETAPIQRMLELNLTIGLGPDWTPSGEDEMLSEMRFAYRHGLTEGIDALTPRRIWQMATHDGAEVVGLGDIIGSLEIDYRADVLVVGRTGADPYEAVLDARARDVRLVFIDGLAYYGDLALMDDAGLNDVCDVIDACGSDKFLCVRDTPGHESGRSESVDDVRDQLRGILATYGRTDDLQELIVCE
jgi:cytosine/adenosine deaminase-related metal-dependent hydrolase